MFRHILCVLFLVFGLDVNSGTATELFQARITCGEKVIQKRPDSSDADKCISKGQSSKSVVKIQHCRVKDKDVDLYCPHNELVVLTDLQIAVKEERTGCTKRILEPSDGFCCNIEDNDVLYNGNCMQDIWNPEDKHHYRHFMEEALRKCSNSSYCSLTAHMFGSLRRDIPSSNNYSSYIQVLHRCVKAPSDPIEVCSSRSVKGKTINLQASLTSPAYANKTCTCRVTSEGDDDVMVRAVDLRTAHTGLILSSNKESRSITRGYLPMYGFRDICSGRKINISLTSGATNTGDNLWIQLSGSRGNEVNVTCGETTPQIETTPTVPDKISYDTQQVMKREVYGYWPLIYVAAGSIFTILIVACILGVLLFCRHRTKKKRRRPPIRYPTLPSPADFHQDAYDPPYATVMDDTPYIPGVRVARSLSTQTLERNYAKPYVTKYPRSTSLRSLRPPSAPPPPPPNVHPQRFESAGSVSELAAFLECKEMSQSKGSLGISTIQEGGQVYPTKSRIGPKSRLDSGFSELSHHRSSSRFGFDLTPDSPQYEFDADCHVRESLLESGDGSEVYRERDLLGEQ